MGSNATIASVITKLGDSANKTYDNGFDYNMQKASKYLDELKAKALEIQERLDRNDTSVDLKSFKKRCKDIFNKTEYHGKKCVKRIDLFEEKLKKTMLERPDGAYNFLGLIVKSRNDEIAPPVSQPKKKDALEESIFQGAQTSRKLSKREAKKIEAMKLELKALTDEIALNDRKITKLFYMEKVTKDILAKANRMAFEKDSVNDFVKGMNDFAIQIRDKQRDEKFYNDLLRPQRRAPVIPTRVGVVQREEPMRNFGVEDLFEDTVAPKVAQNVAPEQISERDEDLFFEQPKQKEDVVINFGQEPPVREEAPVNKQEQENVQEDVQEKEEIVRFVFDQEASFKTGKVCGVWVPEAGRSIEESLVATQEKINKYPNLEECTLLFNGIPTVVDGKTNLEEAVKLYGEKINVIKNAKENIFDGKGSVHDAIMAAMDATKILEDEGRTM